MAEQQSEPNSHVIDGHGSDPSRDMSETDKLMFMLSAQLELSRNEAETRRAEAEANARRQEAEAIAREAEAEARKAEATAALELQKARWKK